MLTEAQIAKIKKKAYDHERRKEKKREKYAAEKEASNVSPDAFWEKNRRTVDTAPLLERQNFVFALIDDIKVAMSGAPPVGSTMEEWLHDVQAEIEADVREHGICQMESLLLQFWKRPETVSELTLKANEPTRVFINTGLITALPGHRLSAWRQFLLSQQPEPLPAADNNYVSTKCTACGNEERLCRADYARFRRPFLCTSCRNSEMRARALGASNRGTDEAGI